MRLKDLDMLPEGHVEWEDIVNLPEISEEQVIKNYCLKRELSFIDKWALDKLIRDSRLAVMAEAARFGHWKVEEVHSNWTDYYLLKCSKCGADFKTGAKWNYCPNCGAKMEA